MKMRKVALFLCMCIVCVFMFACGSEGNDSQEYCDQVDEESSEDVVPTEIKVIVKKDYLINETFEPVHAEYEYEYDEFGRCITCTIIEDGVIAECYEYEYDENGNCVKEIQTDSRGYYDCYEYVYDNENRLIKELIYDKEGELKCEKVYDENGNVSYNQSYYEGEKSVRYEGFYNENNLLVKKDRYLEEFLKPSETVLYEYDEHGNCIVTSRYLGDELVSGIDSTYDENGRIVIEIMWGSLYGDSDDIVEHTEYLYDENGRLIKEMDMIKKGWIEYSYDEDGDLLQLMSYNANGEPYGHYEIYEYGYIKIQ